MCVSLLTHVYSSKLKCLCAMLRESKLGLHARNISAGLFCSSEHVHLYTCRETFAGPGRAFRNRMELIATRNDKTVPLPMIVKRGKTTLTSQTVPAGFSCSDSDFLSSYSRPNSSGKCLP